MKTEERVAHTPGEWELVDVGGMSPKGDTDLSYQVVGEEYVCDLIFGSFRKEQTKELSQAEANAAFIVTACNAHEALVDALRAAMDSLLTYDGLATDPDNHEGWSSSEGFFAYKKVRDALAKVEGK